MAHKRGRHPLVESIREIIFGLQDGAIGNLGVVVGLAQAGSPNNIILLGGLATMFAQAISMSTGTYLSIKSEKEYFLARRKSFGRTYVEHKNPLYSAAVMAVAIMFGTLIPILPFLFYVSMAGVSFVIGITLAFLFLVGVVKSKYTKSNWLRSGVEMLLIGAAAGIAGILIGSAFGV